MTLLKNLISEGTENRVNLTRIEINVEHLAQQLKGKDQEKLAMAYVDLKILSESLNSVPYTAFNANHWRLLNFMLLGKVAQLRIVAEDIAEDHKDVDCRPLMGALDLLLVQ